MKGDFGLRQRDKILERDNYTCVYCGNPTWMVDHVIPKSRGGRAIAANGVAACKKCNLAKGASFDIEYITKAIYHLMSLGVDTSWFDEV